MLRHHYSVLLDCFLNSFIILIIKELECPCKAYHYNINLPHFSVTESYQACCETVGPLKFQDGFIFFTKMSPRTLPQPTGTELMEPFSRSFRLDKKKKKRYMLGMKNPALWRDMIATLLEEVWMYYNQLCLISLLSVY